MNVVHDVHVHVCPVSFFVFRHFDSVLHFFANTFCNKNM